MSDTPRTNSILASQPNGGFGLDKGQCIAQWYDHSSQLERENEALRKLLVDARKWLISNEKHSTACPTNIFNQWGRCTCGFVTTIGRIDAAIKEQSHD